jgi:isoquinoline 1-oxidoreductase subunit beta
VLHAPDRPRVNPTVGSESVMLFAEPLAQACAALRDAVAAGQKAGQVRVRARSVSELRAFRSGGLIGVSPEIVHARGIVTGAPLFSADIRLPGTQYGRVLRAPASVEVESRPLHWNIEAARAVPGFIAVVEDCGPPIGQAQGLGIVAARPGALEAIAEALKIEWSIAAPHARSDIARAVDVDAHLSAGVLPNVVMDGTPEDGLWDVDLRVDVPMAAHGPIEPRAAVASWQDGALRVWAGTQDAFYIRDFLADAFGLPPDAVTVQSCRIGGAFGGKTICTVEAEAAALTLATGSPVKVQWTRAQEFALRFHRPPSSHRIRARVAEGRTTDWDHAQMSSHIMFTAAVVPSWMQRGTDMFAGDGGMARGMAAPYLLGRARAAYDMVRRPYTPAPGGAWVQVRMRWPSNGPWTRPLWSRASIPWRSGLPISRTRCLQVFLSGWGRLHPGEARLPWSMGCVWGGVSPPAPTRTRATLRRWPMWLSTPAAGYRSRGYGACMIAGWSSTPIRCARNAKAIWSGALA